MLHRASAVPRQSLSIIAACSRPVAHSKAFQRAITPKAPRQRVAGPKRMAASAADTTEASTEHGDASLLQRFHEAQREVARLSVPDEARLIVDLGRTGVLSTIGASKATTGFPLGSVVEYAVDGDGRPIFALSALSGHTRDLREDPRCSLTVTAPDFKGMAQARFTLVGRVHLVPQAEQPAVRETFLNKNPDSFWVDFGDFSWFRMDEAVEGRFNGGFARAATISATDFKHATPDPVAPFSAPVAGHMNADHAESNAAMVQHYAGLPAESARIIDLDRLGMNMEATYKGDTIPVRLAYPRPAEDRKSIKNLIVEMTREAAKSVGKAADSKEG